MSATPSTDRARRTGMALIVVLAVALAVFYGALPQVPDLRRTLHRLGEGDGAWLALAFACELLSFGGYVVLFRAVFAGPRLGWRASYEITMAGVAATRLLAAGGAGGIAVTAWALSRAGLANREVRMRLAAFLVLLYSVFLGALIGAALGLRAGLFTGPAPFGLTVVPAAFAAAVVAAALALALLPADLGEEHAGARRFAEQVPGTVSAGVRGAIALLRTRRPGLSGAIGWWAFDIAVLWSCLRAFGEPTPGPVVVVSYFVGMLANLLPIPGGIGGVEGGMVGALLGFDVAASPAILAVLAYRAFAFWLPIIPGAIAYVGLRRLVRGWDAERDAAANYGRSTAGSADGAAAPRA